MAPVCQPLGDQGVLVRLGEEISADVHAAVCRLCLSLERRSLPGVVEWVHGYVTVAVYYRPGEIAYEELVERLAEMVEAPGEQRRARARTVRIPTCYGGEFGPDLEDVAARHGLSAGEVIARHSGPEYLVHMLGFAPGFPYLGGLPDELATPRLSTPRLRVPAGSVAIGGAQTGVYPLEMPGGWHLIGRTPLRLFAPARRPPALLRMGDRVRFVPITEAEYRALERGARCSGEGWT